MWDAFLPTGILFSLTLSPGSFFQVFKTVHLPNWKLENIHSRGQTHSDDM